MKLELQGPYSTLWMWAGLYKQPSGRWVVFLSNSRKEKTTISYAKYLMTVKLNRLLNEGEIVAHKDEDITNDDVDNLMITTKTILSTTTNKRKPIRRLQNDQAWFTTLLRVQQQR